MSSPSSRTFRVRLLAPLVVLAMVLVMAPMAPAGAAGSEQERIAETRQKLEQVRAELEGARDEAEGDQIDLEEADRQLEAVFAAVETAQQAVQRQQDAVDEAAVALQDAQAHLAHQQELMGERIGRLYRQARPDPLLTVMDASTLTDAVQQSAYMTAIGRQDRMLVEDLTNAETRVEGRTRALEEEKVALDAALAEQQELLEQVEEVRNDRALIAAASQDLVARLQSREAHLEEEAAELARIVAAREAAAAAAAAQAAAAQAAAARPAAGSQSAAGGSGSTSSAPVAAPPPPSGGGFSWPAGGTVTSGFGPRWGRNHDGIDIAGGNGSPIAAARGGTVISAGPYGGYGNLVIIAHGGGFVTYYAHLSSIAVSNGQSVSTGTYLGGMGCTGSCTGTHLHFEIHAGGVPVDPMRYL